MILLSDSQMRHFIVNGYVTVTADFPSAFHDSVRAQAERIFASKGNPGNDILPAIPQLGELFTHPAVTGALTSILGPGYAMHPASPLPSDPTTAAGTAPPSGQLRRRSERAPPSHTLGDGLLPTPKT